jgi:hypothetical protein
MSVDELIAAANTLNEPDLDRVLHQIATLRARRKSPLLPEEESKLLLKINQSVPSDLRSNYQVLRGKREAETLTDDEYDRLIQLSQQIESIGAERLEALATLAQLRQTSLVDLMKTLGIPPVIYV